MKDRTVAHGGESVVEIIAFYKFVSLPDYRSLIHPLLTACRERNLKGTILLAPEGINGMLAGSPPAIAAILRQIRSDQRFADLEAKHSYASEMPFRRMKVRPRKEIVSLGLPEINPVERVGTYVEPEEWNDLISQPDVLTIDTRNDFEVRIGSFAGAVNPETTSFGEFPEYARTHLDPARHRKVAMFCTGGIRCEKATSFLLNIGFEEVYHLHGGIINYLEKVPQEESMWEGECFVFDDRVTVNHELEPGTYVLCYACHEPVSPAETQSSQYEEGVSCPKCFAVLSPDKRRSAEERQRQFQIARMREQIRRETMESR